MRFFEESFLLANIKLDIVFEMFFLTMNNMNINLKLEIYNRGFIPSKKYF